MYESGNGAGMSAIPLPSSFRTFVPARDWVQSCLIIRQRDQSIVIFSMCLVLAADVFSTHPSMR